MQHWLRTQLGRRPWWMNVLMGWCAFMAFIYVPWDFLFKPVAADQEAWLGLLVYGKMAKWTEPLHEAIYLAGAYGFWRMRRWMWPWASLYMAQLAVGMLIWNAVYVGGLSGWAAGVAAALLFGVVVYALWTAQQRFEPRGRPLGERYGGWGIVTGASAGIGTAFARAMAGEGMPCVLVARREERLRELAAELEKNCKVEVRVVAADLAQPEGLGRVVDAVADLDVSILVNNAGVGYAGRFSGQDEERLRSMVQLNCIAPLVLTRRLLPRLRDRGRGAVIVTGSIAGVQPVPFNTVYAATKAFDRFFGEGLWAEVQGSGVDVLVVEPGPTATEFQEVAGELAHAGEKPEVIVARAFESLGWQSSVVPGWGDWVRSVAARCLPRSLVTLLAGTVMARWTPPDRR